MQRKFGQAYINRHCWWRLAEIKFWVSSKVESRFEPVREWVKAVARIENKADQSMKEAPIHLNHLGVTLFRSARSRG
jgi:hypothetical protein